MNVDIIVSRAPHCRWHHLLASALAGLEGVRVTVRREGTATKHPRGLELLLNLERLTGGQSGDNALSNVSERAFLDFLTPKGESGLVIDLCGAATDQETRTRRLIPLFDGTAGQEAMWLALLAGRAPWLSISDSRTSRPIAIGLPGLEAAHIVSAGADTVLSRLIEGLVRAVRAIRFGHELYAYAGTPPHREHVSRANIVGFGCHRLAFAARHALDNALARGPRWSVAWRRSPERRAPRSESLDLRDYVHLADDGQRYFADPFVIFRDGLHHVFVEEFPYATRKGIVSHFPIDAEGRASAPRPVLEQPFHLSYPQVFERGGQIWMLPEASASGTLDLYRAARFPDRWELHSRLSAERIGDATLFEHEGRLWLTATLEAFRSSTWDGLGLFQAERLSGPWTAHPLNPVLIDARAARPAGMPFVDDGALYRPVQDCSRGYGAALIFARITELDPQRLSQEIVGTLSFDAASGVLGPHTLNWAAGLEVIDLFARPGDLPAIGGM